MFRIEISEKNCPVRSIKVLRSKNICFNCTEKNQKKPTEGETHMHIAQTQVCLKYLPVYQTLHEYLFKAQSKRIAEESPLKSELIRFRKIEEPNNASCYNIDKNEV